MPYAVHMAHQLTIWIPDEAEKFESPESAFAFYTALAQTIIDKHFEHDFEYLVEEVKDVETFSTMCEYCSEDHRPYYDSIEAYKGHLSRVHPTAYRMEYGGE